MVRNRTISPDFWTWEAVIDCQPMTRLLFIGLWNFADDGGVQPLEAPIDSPPDAMRAAA